MHIETLHACRHGSPIPSECLACAVEERDRLRETVKNDGELFCEIAAVALAGTVDAAIIGDGPFNGTLSLVCVRKLRERCEQLQAERDRLDELLHGIPFVHDGRDLTHHFVADGTTDMLRRLAKTLEPQYGREWGSPPVTLENLADDCDLLAAHNVQLRADVARLKTFADSLVARLATQTAAEPQPDGGDAT